MKAIANLKHIKEIGGLGTNLVTPLLMAEAVLEVVNRMEFSDSITRTMMIDFMHCFLKPDNPLLSEPDCSKCSLRLLTAGEKVCHKPLIVDLMVRIFPKLTESDDSER